jgi:cbb3-type cytochrome oxidase subunit 3
MDEFIEWFPWLFGGGTVLFTVLIVVCSTLPFVLIFGGIGYYIYRQSKRASAVRAASQSWPQTTGVVVKSRVEVSGGDTTSVSPRIVYEYKVGAQTYQNDQLRVGERFFRVTSSSSAYDVVDRLPVGTHVVVFYNPANPADSGLER